MLISSDKQEPTTPSPTLTPQNEYSTFVPFCYEILSYQNTHLHHILKLFKHSHMHTVYALTVKSN